MSCLFNSMNYFLPTSSSIEIRNKICDYLQNNNKLIDGIETNEILNMESNNYINTMRSTSTWGGGIEIQAACNIWKWRIIVHNKRDGNNSQIEFLPIESNYDTTINLEWTGGHYEPIRG